MHVGDKHSPHHRVSRSDPLRSDDSSVRGLTFSYVQPWSKDEIAARAKALAANDWRQTVDFGDIRNSDGRTRTANPVSWTMALEEAVSGEYRKVLESGKQFLRVGNVGDHADFTGPITTAEVELRAWLLHTFNRAPSVKKSKGSIQFALGRKLSETELAAAVDKLGESVKDSMILSDQTVAILTGSRQE